MKEIERASKGDGHLLGRISPGHECRVLAVLCTTHGQHCRRLPAGMPKWQVTSQFRQPEQVAQCFWHCRRLVQLKLETKLSHLIMTSSACILSFWWAFFTSPATLLLQGGILVVLRSPILLRNSDPQRVRILWPPCSCSEIGNLFCAITPLNHFERPHIDHAVLVKRVIFGRIVSSM